MVAGLSGKSWAGGEGAAMTEWSRQESLRLRNWMRGYEAPGSATLPIVVHAIPSRSAMQLRW